ncbi:ABC transporter permease [Ectobacillus polymachus]|uniref:ABC transporter permease n=1 Tax=Ectobacillus polymachus TaxID=1508806 RepID=UPI003A895257
MRKPVNMVGMAMVMPSFLILLFLVIYPVFLSIKESFTGANNAFSFENYVYLFTDPSMVSNIKFTLMITVISTILVLGLAYGLACYLRFSKGWMANLINRLYLIPIFIPGVIAVYGFINFYRDNGWVARFIGQQNMPSIIYNEPGLIMINIWFNIPFTTMLLVSALSAIPDSMIESARDVGVKKWQIFTKFLLPLSYRTLLVGITFVFMGIIGSFTAPFLIGKNAPQMLGVSMQQHFSQFNEVGQASAIAVFLFVMCAIVGSFYIRNNLKTSRKGSF